MALTSVYSAQLMFFCASNDPEVQASFQELKAENDELERE